MEMSILYQYKYIHRYQQHYYQQKTIAFRCVYARKKPTFHSMLLMVSKILLWHQSQPRAVYTCAHVFVSACVCISCALVGAQM